MKNPSQKKRQNKMSVSYFLEVLYGKKDEEKTNLATMPVKFKSEDLFQDFKKVDFSDFEDDLWEYVEKKFGKEFYVDADSIRAGEKLTEIPDDILVVGYTPEWIEMRKKWANTKFTIIVESSGMTQSTYVYAKETEDGDIQVPSWEPYDPRWENSGIVISLSSGSEVTHKEYEAMSRYYEEDWMDWNDVCEALKEGYAENSGSSEDSSDSDCSLGLDSL